MAIVAEGRTRTRLPVAHRDHEAIARSARAAWGPEAESVRTTRTGSASRLRHDATATSSRPASSSPSRRSATSSARPASGVRDAAAGMPSRPRGYDAIGATAHMLTPWRYLAFAVDSAGGPWQHALHMEPGRREGRNTFARQAIPMTWDFAEGEPVLVESSGTRAEFSTQNHAKAVGQAATRWVASGIAMSADAASRTRDRPLRWSRPIRPTTTTSATRTSPTSSTCGCGARSATSIRTSSARC